VAAKTKRARITLLKHTIIEGKVTDKGTTVEMDRHKATELVSAKQAEFVEEDDEADDGREREESEQYGVRIETPTHGDPGPEIVEPHGIEPRSKKAGNKPRKSA
jgi:hypothetical protein